MNCPSFLLGNRECDDDDYMYKYAPSVFTPKSNSGCNTEKCDYDKGKCTARQRPGKIVGLTKYLATYDPLNMRSNTLCPGGVYNNQSEEFLKRIKNRIPMQRMASKDEYKGAINFLLSDESKYMTGSTITIDGGRCCW